jgi:transcriptional regulator with XRE-family HTH domain
VDRDDDDYDYDRNCDLHEWADLAADLAEGLPRDPPVDAREYAQSLAWLSTRAAKPPRIGGKRLHARRLELGLSDQDLADLAGVWVGRIMQLQYEGPEHGYDEAAAEAVARALKTTVHELAFDEVASPWSEQPDEDEEPEVEDLDEIASTAVRRADFRGGHDPEDLETVQELLYAALVDGAEENREELERAAYEALVLASQARAEGAPANVVTLCDRAVVEQQVEVIELAQRLLRMEAENAEAHGQLRLPLGA